MERIARLATANVSRSECQSQQESRQPQDRQRKWACSGASVPPHIGHSAKVPSGDRQWGEESETLSSRRETESGIDIPEV